MSAALPALEMRPIMPEDEQQILELLTVAMAGGPTGERSREYFLWKHRDNPFGSSPGLVATHDGRVVGLRLFLRWRFQMGSRVLQAVRPVDTATHPEYARQGIFTRLTLALLDDIRREDGVDIVFNTPNASSLPGYLRMGWQEVGRLPVEVAPVHLTRFIRGVGGARRANASRGADAVASAAVAPLTHIDSLPPAAEAFTDDAAAIAELVAARGPSPRLRTVLTPEYLHWRYVEPPGLDYRCIRVERRGRVVGVAFGRLRTRAGLVELTLGDLLTAAGDAAAQRDLLRAAKRSGADHVTFHSAAAEVPRLRLLACGFVRVPGSGITLVANPACSAGGLRPDQWALSLGDLEVF